MSTNSDGAQDPLGVVLHNAEGFDWTNFRLWIGTQPERVQKTAKRYPPNRVYELKGKLCYVLAYAPDGHLVVRGVGDPDLTNVHCEPDEVKDVTNDVRRQRGLPAV